MELPNWIGRRGRLVRLTATAVLAAVAVQSLRGGKRRRALLAGGGALAVGAASTTLEPIELADEQELTVRVEPAGLQCSVCTKPIVPGQPRRPSAENKPTHEACL